MSKYLISYRGKQGETVEADGIKILDDFIQFWDEHGFGTRTVMLVAKDVVEEVRKEDKNV